jgi:hypothetical protein
MSRHTTAYCATVSTVLFALGIAAAPVYAVEATLTVRETAGVARPDGVVNGGVPFAQGAVTNCSVLSVSIGGKPVPAQFEPIAKWADGSVRWALMTCRAAVPAKGTTDLTVRDDGRNPAPKSPIEVVESADAVRVSTGPLRFSVSKKRFGLLDGLEVDGKARLSPEGRGLVLYAAGPPKQVERRDQWIVKVTEYDPGAAIVAGPPSEVVVEQRGPMRAVIAMRGRFPGVHKDMVGYTARLTADAGGKAVNLRVWLENDGAHGYKKPSECFHFDGLAVELGLDLGGPITATCEGVSTGGAFRVRQTCGGQNWSQLAYAITSGTNRLAQGKHTDGVVALAGPQGRLTAAVRHFWQNYDKAIAVDGAKLNVWLWPTDAQWPRLGSGVGRYREPPRFTKFTLNALPGGVHKGHEIGLDFSGRPAAETHAELAAPLTAVAPAYFAATEAANALFAPADAKSGDEELDWKFRAWNNMAANIVDPESPGGLVHAATKGAEPGSVWFGWMDFGDICSPYGGNYGGWVAPRNLHHDWTWVVLLQYLRTGDPAYLERGTAMARHQMEVDFNWSDRDAAPHRRLFRHDTTDSATHTRWSNEYGFALPRAEKNWLSGVALYYLLTGDPKARECALRNYEGLKEGWIEPVKAKPSPHHPLYPSLLTIRNLLALHAITGESKYLDDIQTLFEKHILEGEKEWGPHLFDPRRELRGQEHHQLANQYCYGIATLCELHHRTGDDKIDALLKAGAAKPFANTFYEAPLYLSDLYAYVGHITDKREAIEKGMDAFIDTFPESKHPPIFRPGMMAWTERPAMVLQAGHVLQWVAWQQRHGLDPQESKR